MKKMNYLAIAVMAIALSGTALVAQEKPVTPAAPAVPEVPASADFKNYVQELSKLLGRYKGILNSQGDLRCQGTIPPKFRRTCTTINNLISEIESYEKEIKDTLSTEAETTQTEDTAFSGKLKDTRETYEALREDIVNIMNSPMPPATSYPMACRDKKPNDNGWILRSTGQRVGEYRLYPEDNKEIPLNKTKPISASVGDIGTGKPILPDARSGSHVEVFLEKNEVVCIGNIIK